MIGPPPDVSSEQCGSVEALVGSIKDGAFDGAPVMRVYWQPSEEDIERMQQGHLIEFTFFTAQMPMHAMKVF